jgi:hypothetical protein
MRRLVWPLALLAACAPIVAAPPPPFSPTPIALHADRANPPDINAAFGAEVASRYPAQLSHDTVANDLAANGFLCTPRGVYPDVQPGEELTRCELPKPHGLCSDKWTVSLRLRPMLGKVSIPRVEAQGGFERFCIAGASPNG